MMKCQRSSASKSLGVSLFVAVCLFMSAGAHAWTAEVLLEPDRLFVQPGEQIEIAVKARITVDAAAGSEPVNGSRPTGEQVVGIGTYRVPMKLEGLYYVGHQTTTMTQLVPTGNNLVLSYSYINTSITFTGDQAEFNCQGGTSTVTCDLGPFATIVLGVDESLEAGDTATLTVVAGAAENGVRIQSVRGGYPSNSISTQGNEVTVRGGYIDGSQLEFVVGFDLDINGDGSLSSIVDFSILLFWSTRRANYVRFGGTSDPNNVNLEAAETALSMAIAQGWLSPDDGSLIEATKKLLRILPADAGPGHPRFEALDFDGRNGLTGLTDFSILFFWSTRRATYVRLGGTSDPNNVNLEAAETALSMAIAQGWLSPDDGSLLAATKKLLRILPPGR